MRADTVVVRDRLDADAMTAAASTLLGLGDFAPFCKKREGATTIRTLIDYSWVRGEDGVVEGRVVADAFCHSMVRALVGAVVPVGEGRREVGFPAEVMAGGIRDGRVKVMPAHGLSLEEVGYPPDGQARRPRRRGARRFAARPDVTSLASGEWTVPTTVPDAREGKPFAEPAAYAGQSLLVDTSTSTA